MCLSSDDGNAKNTLSICIYESLKREKRWRSVKRVGHSVELIIFRAWRLDKKTGKTCFIHDSNDLLIPWQNFECMKIVDLSTHLHRMWNPMSISLFGTFFCSFDPKILFGQRSAKKFTIVNAINSLYTPYWQCTLILSSFIFPSHRIASQCAHFGMF